MKLALGTVQFGLDYGISNKRGKVSVEEAAHVLESAAKHKVRVLDTAAFYGNSEELLGSSLSAKHDFLIVTKTPTFNAKSRIEANEIKQLKLTFEQSLKRLQQEAIYGLLIHNVDDLFKPGGNKLMAAMVELKNQGLIKRIGASVYTAEHIDRVVNDYSIDLIQVPLNVFDQRLLQSGHLQKLKKHNIEIHARSVFLQGLLLLAPNNVAGRFKKYSDRLRMWNDFCRQHSISKLQAALGFVLQRKEVDYAVVGVTCVAEFDQLCKIAKDVTTVKADFSRLASTEQELLNPFLWK